MSTYGYVRVSSADQNEARQVLAMKEKGLGEESLFIDKASGKDFERPMYQAMLKTVHPGDLVFVGSIDRLGRNYEDIIEQWRVLTKEKKIDICVLDMPLLDTRRGKDFLGTFIADLVLQVLSFVSQSERENIRKRQAEGIAAAKAAGKKWGGPSKVLPGNFRNVVEKWRSGELSVTEAARLTDMARSTFRKHADELIRKEGTLTFRQQANGFVKAFSAQCSGTRRKGNEDFCHPESRRTQSARVRYGIREDQGEAGEPRARCIPPVLAAR